MGSGLLLLILFLLLRAIRKSRQLSRSQQNLQHRHELILNSVADGIYGVDLEGRTTFVNHAMEQLTGWSSSELIGHNAHQLLHHTRADGTPHPSEECPIYHTSSSNRAIFIEQDIFWRRDGSPIPVEYSSTPIRGDEPSEQGAVVVFRDLSARLQATEAARQHQAELAHMARLSTMGEMTSGIAHELNQPLAAIVTNAQACIRLLHTPHENRAKLEKVLGRIAEQAERAAAIIRQLRRMARKEEPESTHLDLNALIKGLLPLLEPEARKAGVAIRIQPGGNLPPIAAQRIQIEQVLLNLCRNAIESMVELPHGQPRQLLITSAHHEPQTLLVRVSDSGPGPSTEVRERLFPPFTTTKPKGMGLGLSISHGIIEAHRGRLYVETHEHGGVSFCFTLPVCEDL